MSLFVHQRGRVRGFLPWVLSCLLLAQALVPIQAHTQWATESDGTVVVICTLLGDRTEVVDFDPGGDRPSDEYQSPACLFSTLLGATLASDPVLLTDAEAFKIVRVAGSSQHFPNFHRFSDKAIRAPPAA